MSYLELSLLPNERVLYRAKIHWIIFVPGIIVFFIATLFTLLALLITDSTGDTIIKEFLCYCPILTILMAAFLSLLRAAVYKLTTIFGITNQRVIVKTGFIRRNTQELLIAKTESINIDQNVIGRLFNYGKITVVGTGGSREAIDFINNPTFVRKVILKVLEKNQMK